GLWQCAVDATGGGGGGGDSDWSFSGSNIYRTNGKVGIGTSSAIGGATLHVKQAAGANGIIIEDSDGAAGAKVFRLDAHDGKLKIQALADDAGTWQRDIIEIGHNGNVEIPTQLTNDSGFWTVLQPPGTNVLTVRNTNVGIMNSSPDTRLYVNGNGQVIKVNSPNSSAYIRFSENNADRAYIGRYLGNLEFWNQSGGGSINKIGGAHTFFYGGATINDTGLTVRDGLWVDTGNTTIDGPLYSNNSIYVNTLCNRSGSFCVNVQNIATTPSSQRWKENVTPLENVLPKVLELEGVEFDWIADFGGEHDIGMIAEEVGKVFPELVEYEENGVDAKSLNYGHLTAVLVEAIKEQQAQIEALKETVCLDHPEKSFC
ncbi:MAG: tail fiber domain-containing protein, partial [Candidatus Diapherotrites archaeon]|nr:tail fiber domain-containing protein [Candidatus Diapherotrites archaeon]